MAQQRSSRERPGYVVACEQQSGPINFHEHTLAVLRLAGKIKELKGNAFPDDFLAVREDPVDLERLVPEARKIVGRGILQDVDHVRHCPESGSMTLLHKTDSPYMILVVVAWNDDVDSLETSPFLHLVEIAGFDLMDIPKERPARVADQNIGHTVDFRRADLPQVFRDLQRAGSWARFRRAIPIVAAVECGQSRQQRRYPFHGISRWRAMRREKQIGSQPDHLLERVHLGFNPARSDIRPLQVVKRENLVLRGDQITAEQRSFTAGIQQERD